tara:strand:- start:256 stop:588 length:333 start_codon:yes stop_codon:yes gene_type:complete
MTTNDSENKNLDKEAPSLFQMLKSFTKEAAKFIKAGTPMVSEEDYAERLDACVACEHVQKKHMRCGLCGCVLQFKARMKTTVCPDTPPRWKTQILTAEEQEAVEKEYGKR